MNKVLAAEHWMTIMNNKHITKKRKRRNVFFELSSGHVSPNRGEMRRFIVHNMSRRGQQAGYFSIQFSIVLTKGQEA
jgi:hypothetical protein